MLPVMQGGRVRPGAPPEHDVLHPVGGGLGQARPTNNIGIHGGAAESPPCPFHFPTRPLRCLLRFMIHTSPQSRRKFLQTAALTALAAGCRTKPTPASRVIHPSDPLVIIDTHTHFYDPSRSEGVPWPSKLDPFLYRTVLPRHYKALPLPQPVAGTVVVEASPWIEDNQWILDLAAEDPFIVGLVGNLPVGDPTFPAHLKRFSRNPLFRGIRIGTDRLKKSLSDPSSAAHFRQLASRNLSLDLLIGPGDLPFVAQLASRHPRLRIIVDHVSNVPITSEPPPAGWVDGISRASEHENVFCKASGLVEGTGRSNGQAPSDAQFYDRVLSHVWNSFGSDRLIYGSNWPVSERFAPCSTVQSVIHTWFQGKGTAALAKVFAGNASVAYLWKSRG